LPDLSRELTIYLIPGDTPTDVEAVLQELCDEIFCEQLAAWYTDTDTWPEGRVSTFSAGDLTTSIIQCSLICATSH
jgi:hypothetical protein